MTKDNKVAVAGHIEYLIRVWEKKPENHFDKNYWRAHIKGAYMVPRIGELILSTGRSDVGSESQYRVFDVNHPIGAALSELVLDRKSELKESEVPSGLNGLVEVLAYKVNL